MVENREKSIVNKVVVVTGGSKGIGAQIVKTLANENYKVILNYNNSKEQAEKIQQEFEKIATEKIYITLGNLTGNYLLSGFGPRIPIKISMTGSVDTEIKSEFISQGINQTLHRVYVNFNCDMAVVTPMKRYNQNVVNQFIIAEHVIVGNIPNAYYNLEGIEKPSNTINLMK